MGKSYFISVRKRDGGIVPFQKKKIFEALEKSARKGGGEDRKEISKITEKVISYLKENYLPGETLDISSIDKAVETTLKREGLNTTAKVYALYRIEKNKIRKKLKVAKAQEKSSDTTDLNLLVKEEISYQIIPWDRKRIIESLIREADIPLSVAQKVSRNVEKKILSSGLKEISTGLIREMVDNELLILGYSKYINRQKSYGIPSYDIDKLIFSKNLENSNIAAHNPEAVNLVISETTLKQYALNNVFSKEVARAHLEGQIHIHDLGYPVRVYCSSHSLEYLKKYGLHLENLEIISSPAKHARTLTGHLNTFLASMQAYYAGALGIGYINIFYAPFLTGMDYKEMKQEAQYLIFSLSQSAFSRGGQVLFLDANIHTGVPDYLKDVPAIGPGGRYTGLTYKDYEREAQMFAHAMMDVWREGDAYGHIFSFPKMDFHIDENTFNDPKQKELLEYACQIASENGTPYFVFDHGGASLSQCCRLREKITDTYMIQHPESMRFCGFQNVTINLPQAAYRAGKGNIDKCIEEIDKAMDIAVKAHLEKKEFIKKIMSEPGLPLWQIGKTASDGRPYVNLEKATYIIGIIGLNECVQYLTGKQLHEDEEVYKLGIKIISYMNLKTQQYAKKYNLKFGLEESPAESATRRLTKVDLSNYPESKEVVKGSADNDDFYYTNSIHFAANAPLNLVERIVKQSKFHPLIESGAIIHAFIGEEKPSPLSIFNLVKKTYYSTPSAQLTISPEFTVCNRCHKVTRGLKETCAYCGSNDVYGITRIVGYFSRINNWNKSKIGELKDRRKGNYFIEGTLNESKNKTFIPTSNYSPIST